jgi:hypothetical protein
MNDPAEANAPADDDASSVPGTGRKRLRRALLASIALLYLLSVPWYRATDAPLRIVFGMPDWVAVAVACYVAVAFLNAIAWKLTRIPDSLESEEDARQGTP